MRRETMILKIAVIMLGIPVAALSVLLLPWIARDAAQSSIRMAYVIYGILILMYISVVPFFAALYQGFRLLGYIDSNKAFSELSLKSIQKIRSCAAAISIIYLFAMPLFYIVAEIDDAPGVILVGMIFVFAPLTVTVFAAILKKLLKNAIDLKNDNELTI
ncbi:MAG: DUF2975 domain-containing protein [Proteocatella sp.]|jgi:hypothetical protein|nr:DUF2975 domain-containing protein [Proteocatella sp.]